MSPEPPPEAEEPEELQRRIDGLREELARARRLGPDPKQVEAEVESRTKERLPLEVERAAAPLRERVSSLEATQANARERLLGFAADLAAADEPADEGAEGARGTDEPVVADHEDRPEHPDHPPGAPWPEVHPDEIVPYNVHGGPAPEDLPPAELRILEELEKLRTLGVKTVDRRNLAVLAGRSPKSSSYEAHVSALRGRHLISYPSPGHLRITSGGRTLARLSIGWLYDRHPHGTKEPAALHEAWLAYLPGSRAKILAALLERHPEPIRRDELASLVGQSPRSSSFEEHVRVLKALGVAEYPEPGAVRAAPLLFPVAPESP